MEKLTGIALGSATSAGLIMPRLNQAWLCCLQALTSVILKSTSSTMMGLEKELKEAAASLQRSAVPHLC